MGRALARARAPGSGGRGGHRGASRWGPRGCLESPQKLGGPFLVYDHGDKVLVIPDCPKATIRIAVHAEHVVSSSGWGGGLQPSAQLYRGSSSLQVGGSRALPIPGAHHEPHAV